MNYIDAVNFLLCLPDMERRSRGPQARTMSLETMKLLLADLNFPQRGRRTVHVTGSKGKGSTSAFVASALAMNHSTLLYTSPHLHSYRERICEDLHPIAESDFANGVERIMPTVIGVHDGDYGPVSTFGAMTSLFFELCRQKQIEWQVVEVGLGGLLDATNVFDQTDLVVITAISLEHTSILGNTAAEIAANKGAIIKPGSIVVLAEQNDPQVLPVIKDICVQQGARLIDVEAEYQIKSSKVTNQGQSFELHSKKLGMRSFKLQMLGEHQLRNATTAIAAIDALLEGEASLVARELSVAVERVFVPGRMEIVERAPYVILDGAHNGDSASALVEALGRHVPASTAKGASAKNGYVFVLGVNSDKDIKSILEALAPVSVAIVACCSASEKAMPLEKISEVADSLGVKNFDTRSNCSDALRRARELADGKQSICVTGSLYLVAEARELLLGPKPSWSLEANVEQGAIHQNS
jgi:dihydrofolate synthase/folylpolyglutamate synthase